MQQSKKSRSSLFASYGALRTGHNSDELLTAVAMAALRLDDVLLLEEVAQMFAKEPPLEIFVFIREAISKLGFETLRPALESFLNRTRHIHSKWSALVQVAGESAPQSDSQAKLNSKKIERWTRAHVESMISPYPFVSADDGISLAKITHKFGKDMLEQRVALYVEARAASTPFAIAFLVRLSELRRDCQIPAATVRDVCSKIVSAVVKDLNLGTVQPKVSEDRNWPRNNGLETLLQRKSNLRKR
jgi:hypothetical protein